MTTSFTFIEIVDLLGTKHYVQILHILVSLAKE